ncbi:hypothetical protein [Paenibacillus sp. N3.4]|uniref:hypothetical protein n=1 Tax=Paenibacillus sp. N3.4 TaxID=2603222 RepID=UPI0011C87923|nr:hypothetical protein [Paenibacillus sp. N3.4]TXK85026.1 hypothetical protein FU659_05860 [Paenibacillus sp. N3.4]
MLFNLRTDYFLNIMKNVKVSPNGYMALVSPGGSVIYSKATSSGNEIRPEGIDFLTNHIGYNGSFNVKNIAGQQMIVMFNTLGSNQWALAVIVPEDEMIQKEGQIKYISLSIIALWE